MAGAAAGGRRRSCQQLEALAARASHRLLMCHQLPAHGNPADPIDHLEFVLDYLDAEDPDGHALIRKTAKGLAMLESKLRHAARNEEEEVQLALGMASLEQGLDVLASDMSQCLLKVKEGNACEFAALVNDDREELDSLAASVMT